MNLRPFFCYYGGKWRAAPKYPAPEHGTIVEPFAGAAGYATRYPDRKVILVERDPIVAGLWKYLTRVTPAEIERIPATIPENGTVDDLPVCEEARWLVGFWLNGGCSSPRKRPSAWMKEALRGESSVSAARRGSYWGDKVRTRIASQVESIRHWQVIEGSYERAPDACATWFVDPPYEKAGKHYRFGAEKIDYEGLAAWCVSRDGTSIVCENVGATWLPFEPFGKFGAANGRVSEEAIFIRRAPVATHIEKAKVA